ncbi:MAG: hypothetical protein GDA46_00195 [Bdellovibrionales bacterium]|nr:hypothetical protein [Bdellovibrionales bacterium]
MKIVLFFLSFNFTVFAENLLQNKNGENFSNYEQNLKFLKKKSLLLAQGIDNKAFDPFIDFGEFQDNIAEEESLSFFQHGRSLSLVFLGGYQGITFNLRQIYGDSLFVPGLGLSFFIDFHIAFQLSTSFPTNHYVSLYNTSYKLFNFSLDLKYYLHKQYLNEEKRTINPYLMIGPFLFNSKIQITPQMQGFFNVSNSQQQVSQTSESNIPRIDSLERRALENQTYQRLGLKLGLGLEFNLIENFFIGLEVNHLYVNLEHEDQDLSQLELPVLPIVPENQDIFFLLQTPKRPEIKGYKFYGDLFQIMIIAGMNF